MADSSDEALLLQRYGQIEQRLQSYDRTIHNSFYLSLVYVGAVAAAVTPIQPPNPSILVLLIFSTAVFFGLRRWNQQSIRDRMKSNIRKARIESILHGCRQVEGFDLPCRDKWKDVTADQSIIQEDLGDVGSDVSNTIDSDANCTTKDEMLVCYYTGVGVLFGLSTLLYWFYWATY